MIKRNIKLRFFQIEKRVVNHTVIPERSIFYWTVQKKWQYLKLFWSKCGKIRTRITPNTDTLYAVGVSYIFHLFEKKSSETTEKYEECLKVFVNIARENCVMKNFFLVFMHSFYQFKSCLAQVFAQIFFLTNLTTERNANGWSY